MNSIIYKTALDYSKEKNYPKIVELLTKGVNQANNINDTKAREIEQLNEENRQLVSRFEEQKKKYDKKLSERDDKITVLKSKNTRLKEENDELRKKSQNDNEQGQNDKHKRPKKVDILRCDEVEQLEIMKTVGMGAQSEVFEVIRDQKLALKVLQISGSEIDSVANKSKERLHKEYKMINSIDHINIIHTYGFCYGDETHAPSILLEFCPKNLSEAIPDMDDVEKVCCIFEICLGMEVVHKANIIHRDLKPGNILIDENGHVKVSDFGISCYVSVQDQTNSTTSVVGTLRFMAPELLKGSTHYDNKVDIYSFGVVLFFILTGKYPEISVYGQACGKKADIPKNVNEISKKLINKCWSTDPIDRPSFTKIIEYIKSKKFMLIDGIEDDIDEIESFLSL